MREVKVNISCSAFDQFSPNANTIIQLTKIKWIKYFKFYINYKKTFLDS